MNITEHRLFFNRAKATLLAGASAMILMVAPAAAAQELAPPQDGDGSQNEAIIVTGSRIASPTLTSPSPVQVVTAETIENTGTTNVQDVLQQNPAVGVPGQTRTTSGLDTNPGLATINLRNLGADRTLVLIDGRRSVAGIPGTAQVDLSMIPASFIERIDVLTGGASAVYGSDAIAGVVNFIYKKDYDGLKLNAQTGISRHGDDFQLNLNATFGKNFDNGRGNVMLYGGYQKEGAVDTKDRDFAARGYGSLGNSQRQGGATDANLTAAQNLFTRFYQPSTVGPGGIFVIGSTGNRIINPDGTFRAYNEATDGFDAGPFGQIATPAERLTFAARVNYDVMDNVNVFAEATYVNVVTQGRREASPMRTDSSLGAFPGNSGFYPIQYAVTNPANGTTVILNNPLVPTAVFNAATNRNNNDGINSKDLSFLLRTTMFPPGTRLTPTERDNFRAVLGTEIDIDGNWKFDAYYQYGFTKQVQFMHGLANLDNLANALQVITDVFDFNNNGNTTEAICLNASARAKGCVPINVYGLNADGSTKISPEAIDYIQASLSRNSKQIMQVASANLSGSLFELPAGPVQIAVGAEYRKESSKDIFDPLSNAARNGYVQLLNTAGSFNVKEAYGELVAPVLADTPFFHSLTLRAAGRMSDYSTVGTFYAWNVGGDWAPVEDVRFRAVYAHAVRAPNIGELFAPPSAGIVSIVDPCQGVTLASTGTVAENCRAVPSVLANIQANGAFTLTFPDLNGVGGLTTNNPNIAEETGKTFTAGVVINPRSINALRNLTFTADYFDIKLEGAINRLATSTVLNKCYAQGLDEFCQFVTRRPTASGAFSIGSVEQIERGLINSGGSFARGLDFTINYRHDLLGGTAGISAAWTHLLKQGFRALTGDPYDNTMGEFGTPRDTANLTLDWANDDFGVTLNNEYIGPQYLDYENYQTRFVLADGSLPDKKLFRIDSKIYTDLQVRYTGFDKFEFFAGVKNLFNVKRPSIYNGLPGPNPNAIYDAIGQRFYGGVRVSL